MGETVQNAGPLRLYWWRGEPNFGDVLSSVIVAHVCDRKIAHGGPLDCDMLGIGSLIQVMRRNHTEARAGGFKPWIWGAGLLHPVPRDFLKHVRVALVRGPITAALLGLRRTEFGDPGLLASKVLRERTGRNDRVALVPHHSQMDDPEIARLAQDEPALQVIDVAQSPETVCRQIAQCRHVISASLHGLIVADSYGVPNTWLSPGKQSHLKYHDYAASIGRPMINPIQLTDIPELLQSLKDNDGLIYRDGVARACDDLINTFPASLGTSVNTA